MFSQMIEERLLLIESLYEKFQGYGINYHIPNNNSVGLFPEEAKRLLWCQLEAPVANSVVMGSHNGGTELLLGLVKRQKEDHTDHSKIFSVDLQYGDYYDLNMSRGKFDVEKLIGNSAEFARMYTDYYKRYTDYPEIGFVLIDSFHSFKHSIEEFNQINCMLSIDGIVAFHDCGPTFPKKGIYYEKELFDDKSENFMICEAISYILNNNKNYEEYRIPIYEKMNRFHETGLNKWQRGKTSPEQSLFAIRKIE